MMRTVRLKKSSYVAELEEIGRVVELEELVERRKWTVC